MRRLILALFLFFAACSAGGSNPEPTRTSESTTTPTTPSTPTTTEAAPTTAPSTSAVPPVTVEPGITPGEEPLRLGISIHVEGWQREDTEREMFGRHRAALTDLGVVAADHRARLTYELSPVFVRALEAWDDDFITEMERIGHGFGVHADAGGQDPPFRPFVQNITSQREALEALGVTVTHVSGICSASPWVEAAVEAGFSGTTGAVEYCLKSLDQLPAGKEGVAGCSSPADCHGPSVEDITQRMYPWLTSSSSDWLTPDPNGDLVIVIGESGSSLDCLDDGITEAGCVAEPDDITAFTDRIDDYLAAQRPFPVPAALTVSWSIGSLPPDGFGEALFSAIDPYVDDGSVVWATLPEIVAAVG